MTVLMRWRTRRTVSPGLVRRIVALEVPTVVRASQPLHQDSLARVHDEHLAVKRLGPACVERDQVAVAIAGAIESPATHADIRRPGRAP